MDLQTVLSYAMDFMSFVKQNPITTLSVLLAITYLRTVSLSIRLGRLEKLPSNRDFLHRKRK